MWICSFVVAKIEIEYAINYNFNPMYTSEFNLISNLQMPEQVETLHQQTWSMRTAYLADQRKRGEYSNPFLEADRREVAKREAAAKRVHPTLQATAAANQISSQVSGMFSTAAPASTPISAQNTAAPSLPSASSPFPAFTPAASSFSSASPSPFTAPSLSLFGSSSAATSSVFGSSGSSTPSLFGSGTSSSIFGSGPALGSTTPMPGFGGISFSLEKNICLVLTSRLLDFLVLQYNLFGLYSIQSE